MNSKEWRIGNWIHNPIQKIDFQVNGGTIASESIREKAHKDYEGFEPIKLTEEWLVKFGFCRHHVDYYNDVVILKDVVDFETGKLHESFSIKIFPNEIGSAQCVKGGLEISHVHQLQNLLHSLTGEELIILKRSSRGNVLVDQSEKQDEENEGKGEELTIKE